MQDSFSSTTSSNEPEKRLCFYETLFVDIVDRCQIFVAICFYTSDGIVAGVVAADSGVTIVTTGKDWTGDTTTGGGGSEWYE